MSLWSRLANVFRAGAVDRELDDELHFHVEERIRELTAAGMTRTAAAEEAKQAARALFGGSGGSLDAVPTTAVPADRLEDGIDVVELLVLGSLAPSRGAARRLTIWNGSRPSGASMRR